MNNYTFKFKIRFTEHRTKIELSYGDNVLTAYNNLVDQLKRGQIYQDVIAITQIVE